MVIGIPRETKPDEYRVGLLPVGAHLLTKAGHKVLVQAQAGTESGYPDEAYAVEGATIVPSAEDVWAQADMVVKVKEPQEPERQLMRPGQVVFAYFHFAADAALTCDCLERGIVAIAYETIRDAGGRLPLLTPMSEIAGKMSVQEGAKCLEKPTGGRGVLLGGVPGVAPANVVVLGAGVVGAAAARTAAGLGASVVLMDINVDRLRHLDELMPSNVNTIYSDPHTVARQLRQADLVIGAVLVPGARTPRLITREHLRKMKPGSVIVDVAIDQGGSAETSRPTTHQQPTYAVDDVIHYCVTNIPGAVPTTSSQALCNATLPYVLKLANEGWRPAASADAGLAEGVSIADGKITNHAVAESAGLPFEPLRLG